MYEVLTDLKGKLTLRKKNMFILSQNSTDIFYTSKLA